MNTFAKFLALASAALVGIGCATPAQRGALGGSVVGAGLGAIIGGASGNPGVGAAIGAGVGGVTGALIGDAEDHERYGHSPHYHTTSGTYVYRDRVAPPPPPPARPAPSHFSTSYRVEEGHYEIRLVRAPSGEYYEERVWVPNR